jgi:hypothetical protein
VTFADPTFRAGSILSAIERLQGSVLSAIQRLDISHLVISNVVLHAKYLSIMEK